MKNFDLHDHLVKSKKAYDKILKKTHRYAVLAEFTSKYNLKRLNAYAVKQGIKTGMKGMNLLIANMDLLKYLLDHDLLDSVQKGT